MASPSGTLREGAWQVGAERFEFGRNWRRFLATVDESRIVAAQTSLQDFLKLDSLEGLRFLDVGCGSGLFSLAARRLGATVRAFDFDQESVAAAQALKKRFAPDDPLWQIEQGSVLDREWMSRLGGFQIVYAWGVLHHTGDMATAFQTTAERVAPGGKLFLAIYNDQGIWSQLWRRIKRLYVLSPRPLRPVVVGIVCAAMEAKSLLARLGHLLVSPGNSPRATRIRGMSYWHDLVDWCGGYPFEVAKPEQIFDYFYHCGFILERLQTCGGGLGCNQFVFVKGSRSQTPPEAAPTS